MRPVNHYNFAIVVVSRHGKAVDYFLLSVWYLCSHSSTWAMETCWCEKWKKN